MYTKWYLIIHSPDGVHIVANSMGNALKEI